MSRRIIKLLAAIGILAGIALAYVVSSVEKIALVATGDVLVRKDPYGPFLESNIPHIMHEGEELAVDGCESTKSDVVVRTTLPNGDTGYVSEGAYVLDRERFSLEWIARNPTRAVFSCRGMFENRSR